MIKDEPYTYEDGTPVRNADGRYHGNVTVREAIIHSYNIPAVKVLTEITPETGYNYLTKFRFSQLLPSESSHQSIALGGLTNGVSNLELTGAYAAIANGGTYNQPILYTKVTDSDGNVILDNTNRQSTQVFRESTAYLLTSAMEDVVERGTGTACQIDGMAVAGKPVPQTITRTWCSRASPLLHCRYLDRIRRSGGDSGKQPEFPQRIVAEGNGEDPRRPSGKRI